VWPPVTGIAHAGSGVSGTFGTIKRPDGSTQVTFDGHPVYEFSGDKAAGQVNGDGAQGGTWHVVTLSGAAASSSSASSSSGGGYTY
jgi:predicted lipoprotein with Yx(FWY)xxD motif